MFFNFLSRYARNIKTPQNVTKFHDAYKWIETYVKAEEFDTAIHASHELLLKIKSGITYYTHAEKKVLTFASSNLEEVAKAAKAKAKMIDKELHSLYEWEVKVKKLIERTKDLKKKSEEKKRKKEQEIAIKEELAGINEALKKREYTEALFLAKKLATKHYDSAKATDTLERVQKIHQRYKLKEEREAEDKRLQERFFAEAGIKAPEWMNELHPSKGGKFQLSHIRRYIEYFLEQQTQRREYVKHQKALRGIEQLLLKTGSISKINESDTDTEIETIMESGLTKDITSFRLDGFQFYGKIIGKDKIVGDTFGSQREGSKTLFYFWDATGHGIQSGFTVSLLTKIFHEQAKKVRAFHELLTVINNELKEKLRGRIFVTGVLFEHEMTSPEKLKYIGAWHDPLCIYKHASKSVERVIPGGLALGVRKIVNTNSIKIKDLTFEDGDILVGYTDGIIEARNPENELYGLDRLAQSIGRHGRSGDSLQHIYQCIIDDVRVFMGSETFGDDVSCFLFRRDSNLDVISDKAELDALLQELDTNQRTIKLDLKGKTRAEIQEEIRKEKKKTELKARLANMEQLYKMGEYWRLKQEVALCYKLGFVDARMNFYLQKVLKNEKKAKVLKLEDRLKKKYDMLQELYNKGEYGVVIRETIDVLYKNGNI